MANVLTNLRFSQAPSLVDDPANPHAKVMLIKRRVTKAQPSATHVDSPDWLKKDAEYIRTKQASRVAADANYLTTKRKGWA